MNLDLSLYLDPPTPDELTRAIYACAEDIQRLRRELQEAKDRFVDLQRQRNALLEKRA